jgi:integrase
MQKRPYPERDGWRVWLSADECFDLLNYYAVEPERQLALALGLHGLRVSEVVDVEPRDIRENHADRSMHVLTVTNGKDGRRRELPLSPEVRRLARKYRNSADVRSREPLVGVSERSVSNWIEKARGVLDGAAADHLGMHDLRRTWATRTYYDLAAAGVPIAESLVMSWGGWKQNARGRETFRENYLGPVPDSTTAAVAASLDLPAP